MKAICFIVCCFTAITVSAQLRFGLRTGFHVSNIEKVDARESGSAFNMHSGVVVDWTIDSTSFHLQGQLLYKPMGYSNSNIQAADTDGDILSNGDIASHRISYIEVPLYILYQRDNNGTAFFGGAGPFLSFRTGDRMTMDGGEKFGNESALPLYTNSITPVLLGLGLQAGIEWNSLTWSLQYQRSFNDIYKNQTGVGPGWKINVFAVSMGYYFGRE